MAAHHRMARQAQGYEDRAAMTTLLQGAALAVAFLVYCAAIWALLRWLLR